MSSTVIIGTQWGDEGKGRVVDVYAANASMVVRYQGGDNAGHTVKVGDVSFALHLIPSGIIRQKPSILGNGMVINPQSLLKEIRGIELKGLQIRPYIFISEDAHMIMPYHMALDGASERAAGSGKVELTDASLWTMSRDANTIAAGRETVGDTTTLEDYSVLAKLRSDEE